MLHLETRELVILLKIDYGLHAASVSGCWVVFEMTLIKDIQDPYMEHQERRTGDKKTSILCQRAQVSRRE